ncbi:hypothetical protein R1sor_014030 [Riccia sorocarpa]|uniref:BTB/POZ domain-containing protein n=1 Tax=Riccia sorocarpa TaxID=122646 RepID=A0ABD3HA61_9MARC
MSSHTIRRTVVRNDNLNRQYTRLSDDRPEAQDITDTWQEFLRLNGCREGVNMNIRLSDPTSPARIISLGTSGTLWFDNGGYYDSRPQRSLVDAGFEGVNLDGPRSHSDLTCHEVLVSNLYFRTSDLSFIDESDLRCQQLDVGTRTCIRAALYRLARSAKERRSFRSDNISKDFAELDSVTTNSCVIGVSSYNISRCTSETQTNHLDRSVASLLFSTEPYWRYSQQKFWSVADIQSGPWQGSSTAGICSNLVPPPCDNVESGVSSSMDGAKSFTSTAYHSCKHHDNAVRADNSGYPQSYEPLGTQEHRVNAALSSNMPPLVSGNEVVSIDMFGLASQSTASPEDVRLEGISEGHQRREIEPGVDNSFGVESMLATLNQQSGLTPCREVGGNDITVYAGLQENSRFVNRLDDIAESSESYFSSQFSHPDRYEVMTVRNRLSGGHSMNCLTTSDCTIPSGKDELSLEEIWSDR